MREFYLSPTDAFLWIGAPDGLPWSIDYANQRRQNCRAGEQWHAGHDGQALLYRLPLDGSPIGAISVDGVPADQFALDSRDGRFRALLARSPRGCFKPRTAQPMALLDVPLSLFSARLRPVDGRAYADLPPIAGSEIENRFIGNWLVYGGRREWSADPSQSAEAHSNLVAVPVRRPAAAMRLALPHNAIRIERAGRNAIVTGYHDEAGLSLSHIDLDPGSAALVSTTTLARRFESEGRSHAFNAWVRADGSGLIGIPTTFRGERSGRGWSDSESSDLSYVAIGPDRQLRSVGEIEAARRQGRRDYRCEVSCIDWYGNSRPIFTGGRVFALMGTELVEGRLAQGRIGVVGRLDLTGPIGRPPELAER
jgi:hypothetical protein